MEQEKIEHPGRAALLEIQFATGTTHKGYLAIQYMAERLEKLEKIIGERNSAFKEPTPAEATEYAKSIGFVLDGQQFCDFYSARGWLLGRTKMKSWKACIKTWKARRNEAPVKPQRLPDNLRNEHGL